MGEGEGAALFVFAQNQVVGQATWASEVGRSTGMTCCMGQPRLTGTGGTPETTKRWGGGHPGCYSKDTCSEQQCNLPYVGIANSALHRQQMHGVGTTHRVVRFVSDDQEGGRGPVRLLLLRALRNATLRIKSSWWMHIRPFTCTTCMGVDRGV